MPSASPTSAAALTQVALQNTTACNAMFMEKRSNYAAFVETLLPVTLADYDPISALVDASVSGNSSRLENLQRECHFGCLLSLVLSAIFSSVTLLMVTIVMCISLYFVRRQARRLVKELDKANDECAKEHHDKVKLLRYAGVSLD